MRQPLPSLCFFITGKSEVPAVGAQFDDIIDCTPDGPDHAHRARVLHIPPTGNTAHCWAPDDLDTITELASASLLKGRAVLIHCSRGVSRSTCAAAAVLLYMGRAKTVDEAVSLTRHPERVPVKTALASLTRWWSERQQMTLF